MGWRKGGENEWHGPREMMIERDTGWSQYDGPSYRLYLPGDDSEVAHFFRLQAAKDFGDQIDGLIARSESALAGSS